MCSQQNSSRIFTTFGSILKCLPREILGRVKFMRNSQVTSCMGQGARTQQPTHCVHALTTIFCSRERNRLRFASLHTMNEQSSSELVKNNPQKEQKKLCQALCKIGFRNRVYVSQLSFFIIRLFLPKSGRMLPALMEKSKIKNSSNGN